MMHLPSPQPIILKDKENLRYGITQSFHVFELNNNPTNYSPAYIVQFHRSGGIVTVSVNHLLISSACDWMNNYIMSEYHYHDLDHDDISLFVDAEFSEIFQVLMERAFEFTQGLMENYPRAFNYTDGLEAQPVLEDSLGFLDICQKEYQKIVRYPDQQARYEDLVNVVYDYFKTSLPFLSLRILCDGGVIDRSSPTTINELERLWRLLKSQMCNAHVDTFYTSVGASNCFGDIFIDPVLRCIRESKYYPLEFLSKEHLDNVRKFIGYWLNTVTIEQVIHDPVLCGQEVRTHPTGP